VLGRFGSDALVAHVLPFLPPPKQRRVRELCSTLGLAVPPRPKQPKQQGAAVRSQVAVTEEAEAPLPGPAVGLLSSEREALQVRPSSLGGAQCCFTARRSSFKGTSSVGCANTFSTSIGPTSHGSPAPFYANADH